MRRGWENNVCTYLMEKETEPESSQWCPVKRQEAVGTHEIQAILFKHKKYFFTVTAVKQQHRLEVAGFAPLEVPEPDGPCSACRCGGLDGAVCGAAGLWGREDREHFPLYPPVFPRTCRASCAAELPRSRAASPTGQ